MAREIVGMYKKVQVEETISIACNRCGKEKSKNYDDLDPICDGDFQQFEFNWGYFSNHDTEKWEFDLCEDCLVDITSEFKIPMKVSGYELL